MIEFNDTLRKAVCYSRRELRVLKIETLNLHGLNLNESREKTRQNIEWSINHGVDVLVLNHGKGHHSSGGFAVIKADIRKMLKEDISLRERGYRVVYGESNQPIALTYDEGNTLIVARGLESEHIGGQAQQEKNQRIFSEEAKNYRKANKTWRKNKSR
jgi:hypothetical protein